MGQILLLSVMHLQYFVGQLINFSIPLSLLLLSDGEFRCISKDNIKLNFKCKESQGVEWIQLVQDRAK